MEPTPTPQDTAQATTAQATALDTAQDRAQDRAQDLFYGIFGLRAGWSLLLYLGILALFLGGVFGVAHSFRSSHANAAAAAGPTAPIAVAGIVGSEAVTFAALLLLSWLMAAIEHRRLSAFGLGGRRAGARFLAGALWGVAAMSLLIVLLRSLHLLVFQSRLDHGASIAFWGGLQLLAFLLVGLTEEYTVRGYLQFTLTRGLVCVGRRIAPRHARAIAFWAASLLTCTLFLLAHTGNGGENGLGLFQVFLAGVVFVAALWRTGSLWWAIGFHTTWDWSQSFLYGVPDSGGLLQGRLFATHALGPKLYSGGSAGPEGSVLCIPVLLLVLAVLFFLTERSPQPPLETLPTPPPPPSLFPPRFPPELPPGSPAGLPPGQS